jgi:hypothetical protein
VQEGKAQALAILGEDMNLDVALRKPSGDKLGRWEFSKSLAAQIWGMPGSNEGYVIGLESEWGAGKSSVINLTLHQLLLMELKEKSSQPSFHGDDDSELDLDVLDELTEEYNEIVKFGQPDFDLSYTHPDHHNRAIAARYGKNSPRAKLLYRYFRLRMRANSDPKILVIHFRPWLIPDTAALSTVFIAELSKSVGSLLGEDVERALKDYTEIMKRLAPLAGVAAQAMVSGVGGLVKDLFVAMGQRPDPTLESRKSELERALLKLENKKILIVIDDLDRLSPKEATEMVGLVKSLGNLPNVVYLLSYDATVIAAHLKEVLKIDGDSYLEKIVQYRRSLPLLSANALWTFLTPVFDNLFEKAHPDVLERLETAMLLVAKRYILTPRDAIRCTDWVVQAHRRLGQQTDPVDLFVLEILNAKDPKFYNWIRRNIDELCEPTVDDDVDYFSKMMTAQSLEKSNRRLAALAQLFPSAASEFGHSHGASVAPRSAKRLHIRDFSPAYFELSEPLTTFGKEALERLFSAELPGPEFAGLLELADVSNYAALLRADLLDTIRERFQVTPISSLFVKALVENSVLLCRLEDRQGPDDFSPDNWRRLSAAIEAGVRTWNADGKEALVYDVVKWSHDISLACDVILRFSSGRNGKRSDSLSDQAREYVINAIIRDAASNRIARSVRPDAILTLWASLEGPDAVREHINYVLAHRTHAAGVARFLLRGVRSSDEGFFHQLAENVGIYVDEGLFEEWARQAEKGDDAAELLWGSRVTSAFNRRRTGSNL